MLLGPEGFDDAGAVREDNGRIRLYSVDFFPPVVDDPAAYGAIAAANSLSDIWAMGGEPDVVLNVAGFPQDWGPETSGPIISAAAAKVAEAGALWVGGHTVRSAEPLFGFAVTGWVEEEHLLRHDAVQPGDGLWLTKPLGTGCINTAVSRDCAPEAAVIAAVASMSALNRPAAQAARSAGLLAATDITGFGLMGHAGNMARSSGLRLEFEATALPLCEGAADLARADVFSGARGRGEVALSNLAEVDPGVESWLAGICFDAETSGGLLLAVPDSAEAHFLAALDGVEAARVGVARGGDPAVALR